MVKDFRPRLPKYFEKYIDEIKDFDETRLESLFNQVSKKNSWEESKDNAYYEYEGTKSIRNLPDALKYCKVDLNEWEVDRHLFNSWDVSMKIKTKVGKDKKGNPIYEDKVKVSTNYQCKIWFKKQDKSFELIIKELEKQLKGKFYKKEAKGDKIGVVNVADLHTGAEIKELAKTRDFSVDKLSYYLEKAADKINDCKYKEVHLNILGDLVESISGLNHPNSWKSMGQGMYGSNVIVVAYKLIRDKLIRKINNLEAVYMVPGNHDRFSIDSRVDNVGGIVNLMVFMLSLEFPDLKVHYDDLVLSTPIDGINYITLHGQHKMANNVVKLIADYGRSDMYNVVISAHYHTLKEKKTKKQSQIKYEDVTIIQLDEMNYRAYVAPSIFTGNFYSESIGHTSNAGILILENNGNGIVDSISRAL